MARNSKYDLIKKNFPKIEQLLSGGATEREVARSIGIAYSTWNKYKAEQKEFSELIIKSIQSLIYGINNHYVGGWDYIILNRFILF